MNNPLDPTLRELNDCGCCEGTSAQTPAAIENRPGLPAVAFRAGVHSQFKATLRAALSSQEHPALRGLRTRDSDDFAIALLDAFASTADVLTYYSERIANEAYLGTATERRSVLELARAIGYELKPGVAAATWLAFTVEAPTLGSPGYANIVAGTKVQSLPGPDEKPQVYETTEALLGRHEWNELHPVRTVLAEPYWGQRRVRLKGVTTNLKPGDPLLIVGDERAKDPANENWDFRRVSKLETFPSDDPQAAYSLVTLDRSLGKAVPFIRPSGANAKVFALRQRASLFGHSAPDWRAMPDSVKAGFGAPQKGGVFVPALSEWPNLTLSEISSGPPGTNVGTGLYGEYFEGMDFSKRKSSRLDAQVDFDWGTAVPPRTGLSADTFSIRFTGWIEPKVTGDHTFITYFDDGVRLWVDGALVIDNWTAHAKTRDTALVRRLQKGRKYDVKLEFFEREGFALIQLAWAYPGQDEQIIPTSQLYPRDVHTLHLDAAYPTVLPGSWLVVGTPEYDEVYQVVTAEEEAKTDFTLSGKTTRLTIRGENLREKFNDRVRDVTVFAQSEELPRAPEPAVEPVAGDTVTLEELIPELPVPRPLLVRGAAARVEVLRKGAPLELTPDSGKPVPLTIGQRLTLLNQPTPTPSKTVAARWVLQTDEGQSGWVNATLQQLSYDSATEGAPVLLEAATLRLVETTADGRTRLTLDQPLTRAYDPFTTTILANVAQATHGETVKDEVLGNGDASRAHQQFKLKQKPLTYVPASTPGGAASTLEVWVNDVKWQEATTLYRRGPSKRLYITRRADDGTVTVEFGDGLSGARLPGGQENVRAVYRKGIGSEGRVKAGQLSLLMTRPLGVKSVTNPQEPFEPADPQPLDDARRNAPRTVLTLDRVVSLQDYEDFTRDFPGIGKALATWSWSEHARGVLLSVLGAEGRVLSENGETVQLLIAALRETGTPLVPVLVKSAPPLRFSVHAKVAVSADRDSDRVLAAVRAALKVHFAFEAREFGQGVALSEVVALMQEVPGVDSVDVNEFKRPGTPAIPQPAAYLPAAKPSDGIAASVAKAAELLIIDESSLVNVELAKP